MVGVELPSTLRDLSSRSREGAEVRIKSASVLVLRMYRVFVKLLPLASDFHRSKT